jgi:hypothetical protein
MTFGWRNLGSSFISVPSSVDAPTVTGPDQMPVSRALNNEALSPGDIEVLDGGIELSWRYAAYLRLVQGRSTAARSSLNA